MCVQTAEPYVEPPNNVDIWMTISKLKHGKETGHDQIMAVFITGRKRAQGHSCPNEIQCVL
jgi:hypothetical protein